MSNFDKLKKEKKECSNVKELNDLVNEIIGSLNELIDIIQEKRF